mmetsp:Transcript_47370/g.125741  ORF Transcript_47370/g.125741 Transcript_47370/m.125741 type:complete len:90 (+) Transcript_47370:38-307(+)
MSRTVSDCQNEGKVLKGSRTIPIHKDFNILRMLGLVNSLRDMEDRHRNQRPSFRLDPPQNSPVPSGLHLFPHLGSNRTSLAHSYQTHLH